MDIITELNKRIYDLPIMRKAAKIHPFMPQVVWIVPFALILFLILDSGWIVLAAFALYVFYGFYRTPEKKDIKTVQPLKPGEKVTPQNEKKVRQFCSDKAFAMALERHQVMYKQEAERRQKLGQNIKKNPYKRELADWSAENWDRLKITFEDNMLKLYGLEREEK